MFTLRFISVALAVALGACDCPTNDADKVDCGYAGIDQVRMSFICITVEAVFDIIHL